MKQILLCIGILAISSTNVSIGADKNKSSRPNVLFIAIDDLNDWVGCLAGHPQAQTPNIDRLAKRGMLFTNAHCASPACNPSRAALFSGKMPWKTGVWSNKSKKLFRRHPKIKVLPRAFSDAGYVTLGTGKMMHSGAAANRVMFDQHFDVHQRWSPFTRKSVEYTDAELPSKGSNNPSHLVSLKGAKKVRLPLNRMPSDRNPKSNGGESFDWGPLDIPDSAMGDTQITDWAIQKLKSNFDKPFFLGVGYYRPHIPLWAPQKYFDRFADTPAELPFTKADDLTDLSNTARKWAIEPVTAGLHATVIEHGQWRSAVEAYLACTTFVDHQIGRLLDALDDGSIGDNTVIVLWSDHGWHLGEKQHWGKWTGWERSTRVPLIIVPPKQVADRFARAGSKCDQPVSLIDLYPTLGELCDVPVPSKLDGKSLVPMLRDPKTSSQGVLTVFRKGNYSYRTQNWRYIRYTDGAEELYDHRIDPHELTNVAADPKNTALLKDLRQKAEKSQVSR
ncbi:MAG: sulfatase [Planctomycetes bacterium]|nr:sulfatase [Planctomycetota bacterium]MCH9726283.1 sulfatase [Planctomycetota bacterium]MCH9776671.1 sulfatase [Planctomycetota bacterium]MCH9793141.1 sulfatase [Planctomycetota bacterium]